MVPHGYNRDEGGRGGPPAGWKHEEDVKKEISEKLSYHNNGNARSIICLNDMKVFKSIREASEYYEKSKLGRPQISEVCRGRKTHIKGYYFDYYEKEKDKKYYVERYRKLKKERERKIKNKYNTKSRMCKCIETQVVYESCSAAGIGIGVTGGMISMVCSGKRASAKGYTFEYI